MTRKPLFSSCRISRQASSHRQPMGLCALILLVQIQVSTAGYFRSSTGRVGYGSTTRNRREYFFTEGETGTGTASQHAVEARESYRPGTGTSVSRLSGNTGETKTDGDENYDEFFQVDQTEFPSLLPPTSSPMPTYEWTPEPTDQPSTLPNATQAPSFAPSDEDAAFTPLKFTASPTVAPTVAKKQESPKPSVPATTLPSAPAANSQVSLSVAPTQSSSVVADPLLTLEPTFDSTPITTQAVSVAKDEDLIDYDADEGDIPDETFFQSLAPTDEETNINTVLPTRPTLNETEMPEVEITTTTEPTTAAPTDSPTTVAEPFTLFPTTTLTRPSEAAFPVAGQVSLHLRGITIPFSGTTRNLFLTAADHFVASASVGTVENIRVIIVYQKLIPTQNNGAPSNDPDNRRLQQDGTELRVDLGVEGLAHDETFSASAWNNWLENLFYRESRSFTNLLQEMGDAENDPFFVPLQAVELAEPEPIILQSPGPAPANAFTADESQGVPMVAIIGGAVGGCVFLIVGLFLIRYAVSLQKRKRSASSVENNSIADQFGTSSSEKDGEAGNQNSRGKDTSRLIRNKPSVEGSISSESYLTNNAGHQINYSSTMGSSNPWQQPSAPASEFDTMSQMGGTITDMSQMDNNSYAYSLEPGIEPSVTGVPQSVAASGMSYSAFPGESSVASGTSSFAFLKMPISQSSSGGLGSPSSVLGKPTKDVLAPPGKLGIVIDTTLDGPVVHKVNPGSALEGKLKSGDIIVAIDDVDTRAMTAASITALMVKTANQRRKLTIVSA